MSNGEDSMKIVQIMPEFGLAGAEIMCENLTYELIKLGHNVTVVSMYDYYSAITERLEKAGVDVRYLGKKPGLDFSMYRKMMRSFKDIGVDVVHTHRYCAQYAIPVAILAGVKKRVHTVHSVAGKENRKPARRLNQFFFKHCHLIPVALSERIRDSIVTEYGINKDKIPVIYNGIDLSKCQPKIDYSIVGKFKILHIGRFSEEKNHIGLIKAFNQFHVSHSDSELWLVGDGKKKAEIETYVAENNLSSSVKFWGLQENVYGYLHDADMFALPSNYEGIPVTLIEAMGTGLPVVASAVGGIPDMIQDGVEGILCTPDVNGIAAAIERMYEDQTLREYCGKNAKNNAYRFSADIMAKKYLYLYQTGGCVSNAWAD